jgi:heavy metal sensor kinase
MKPWSAASIRLRLTSWYTFALALMLIVYATATYVAVRHEFLEQLDDQLHDDFETAEGVLTPTSGGRVSWAGDHHHDPDNDADRRIDVWSANGERIYASTTALALPPAALTAITSIPRYESIAVAGQQWRTLTGTTSIGGRAVVLRVTRSEDRVLGQLSEVLTVLVLGLPLVVVLAGVGGYLLARRALTPIDHLASEARRITAERLHERLFVPNQHDEIGRLAAVINDTLARLEASFAQLRRFTADASHELRTPLSVIRGIGEMGLGETRTPAEYKEAMGSMLEEVDRLTHLVDTLLRLSHGDAGTVRLSREPVDLGQLTREVVASLAILAEERNQQITIDDSSRTLAHVDRLVLREAITNLLDNAIKYSRRDSMIAIRVAADGDQAVFEVSDQGPGIHAAHRERIFDRFFRVDEARSRESGGTGLGLAIAKWAVEVHGGQVSVQDNPTGGSVFRFTLPLVAPADSLKHETHATRGSGERV